MNSTLLLAHACPHNAGVRLLVASGSKSILEIFEACNGLQAMRSGASAQAMRSELSACCQPPREVQQLPGTLTVASGTATSRTRAGWVWSQSPEPEHASDALCQLVQHGVVAGHTVANPPHSQSRSCGCEREGCPSQHTRTRSAERRQMP